METFWQQTIKSGIVAQTDLFKRFSDYLSDHLVFILGGLAVIIIVTLLLSKKMTASGPANKKSSGKMTTKQGQYKKYR